MRNVLKSVAYINGKIITMDSAESITQAVLTIGDKIMATGSNDQIKEMLMPNTEVVDLGGKVMMPGLIDGHVHMEWATTCHKLGGLAFTPPCNTMQDILNVIKAQAEKTPSDEWVVVRGGLEYQSKIAENRHLTVKDIDAVVNTHPVAFVPAIHTVILNTKGIEKMGWFHEKFMPVNATLGRDKNTGELTGIFCETMETAPISPWNYAMRKEAMRQGTLDFWVTHGVTSIHELPSSIDGIRVWQELKNENASPVRVKMFLTDIFLLHQHGVLDFLKYGLTRGLGDSWVSIGGVKIFADGTEIHANGYPVQLLHYTQEEMNELVYKSHEAGWQIWTHAMTEDAFEQTLIAYENALERLPKEDSRMRIEHAGDRIGNYKRADEFVARMKKAGIIPMLTPTFLYAAAYYDLDNRFHAKTLIDKGFKLPGNSDATGGNPLGFNLWQGIWSIVNRRNVFGDVKLPEEKLTVMQALKMYTIWAAWAAFEEDIKGSIEAGKLADLIILGDDPLTCDPEVLKDMQVETVIIGGEVKKDGGKWY